ncbi:MAG: hypothetical protein ACKN9T_11325 [Candidatus Methylumidiphilus sp.]
MSRFPLSIFAASLAFSMPAFAVSPDVEAALQLVKQTHADLCQQRKIKVQLLAAHQAHDQDKLDALEPQLEAINKRLKPTTDQLNALKAKMNKNPDDKSAFEAAMLEVGDCEGDE